MKTQITIDEFSIRVLKENGLVYFSLADMAKYFRSSFDYDPKEVIAQWFQNISAGTEISIA